MSDAKPQPTKPPRFSSNCLVQKYFSDAPSQSCSGSMGVMLIECRAIGKGSGHDNLASVVHLEKVYFAGAVNGYKCVGHIAGL